MKNTIEFYSNQIEFLRKHIDTTLFLMNSEEEKSRIEFKEFSDIVIFICRQCARISTIIDCQKLREFLGKQMGSEIAEEQLPITLGGIHEEEGLITFKYSSKHDIKLEFKLQREVEGQAHEEINIEVNMDEIAYEEWSIDCNKVRQMLVKELKLSRRLTASDITISYSKNNLLVGDNLEILNEEEGKLDFRLGDNGGILFFIPTENSDIIKKFNMKKLFEWKKHSKTIMENCLISLISTSEDYLRGLFTRLYTQYPKAIDAEGKHFSLNDFSRFDSQEDAKAWLIDKKVDDLMRGSFNDSTFA